MMDVYGSKPRKRRRKAKLLADDLTKDSIESYYVQKQANKALEDQKPTVAPIYRENVSEDATEPIKGHVEDEAVYSLLDDYKVDSEDVRGSRMLWRRGIAGRRSMFEAMPPTTTSAMRRETSGRPRTSCKPTWTRHVPGSRRTRRTSTS